MDWPWAGSLYLQDPMGGFCQTNKVIPIGGKNTLVDRVHNTLPPLSLNLFSPLPA